MLRIVLFLGLVYILSSCSTVNTVEENDIPNSQGYEDVNAYADTLIAQFNAHKEPLGLYPDANDYTITLKNGNDDKVQSLLSSFTFLCERSNGSIYFDGDEWADPITFSPEYLLKEFKISQEDMNKYGAVIKEASWTILNIDKPPTFDYRHLDPRALAAFHRTDINVSKHNGFYDGMLPARRAWKKKSAICATLKKDSNQYYFSWRFGVSPQRTDKTYDLYVTIRNSKSLKTTEKVYIEGYFLSKAEDEKKVATWYENKKRRLAEQQKEQDKKIRAQKKLDEIRRKKLKEYLQKTVRFREALTEGDETHCGLVIDVKPKIANIQKVTGPYWIKKDKLYPKGLVKCKFVNGQYVAPTEFDF